MACLADILAYKQRTRPDGGRYTERQIAGALGVTHPVVPQAMKLHRAMQRLGTDDPYEVLTGPPAGSNKMRRHKHPHYSFQPPPDHKRTISGGGGGGDTGGADAA